MMKTGMLWFDNDPKADLDAKISKASSYYQRKYGQKPNLCFVHPSMVHEKPPHFKEIEVRVTRKVLPHHLWLGVNEPLPQV
jgi:hypothetical protein